MEKATNPAYRSNIATPIGFDSFHLKSKHLWTIGRKIWIIWWMTLIYLRPKSGWLWFQNKHKIKLVELLIFSNAFPYFTFKEAYDQKGPPQCGKRLKNQGTCISYFLFPSTCSAFKCIVHAAAQTLKAKKRKPETFKIPFVLIHVPPPLPPPKKSWWRLCSTQNAPLVSWTEVTRAVWAKATVKSNLIYSY